MDQLMSLGHTAFINESKGKKGENGIRETKRKHLLKTIYWLQTLVRKAHLGCLLLSLASHSCAAKPDI